MIDLSILKILVALTALILFSFNALAQDLVTPEAHEDLISPLITQIRFDDKAYFPSDIISSTPRISAIITDEGGQVRSIEVWVSSDLVYSGSPGVAFDVDKGVFDYILLPKQKLKPGTYEIYIKAWDDSGNLAEERFSELKVILGLPKLAGPTCYPLTFKPGQREKVVISYNLSIDSHIKLLIYSAAGDLIWSMEVEKGMAGGRQGFNKISWDGRGEFDRVVPNGLYHLRIVSGNRVLGSGKFIVAD